MGRPWKHKWVFAHVKQIYANLSHFSLIWVGAFGRQRLLSAYTNHILYPWTGPGRTKFDSKISNFFSVAKHQHKVGRKLKFWSKIKILIRGRKSIRLRFNNNSTYLCAAHFVISGTSQYVINRKSTFLISFYRFFQLELMIWPIRINYLYSIYQSNIINRI